MKKEFTLIELLLVITIVMIIAIALYAAIKSDGVDGLYDCENYRNRTINGEVFYSLIYHVPARCYEYFRGNYEE